MMSHEITLRSWHHVARRRQGVDATVSALLAATQTAAPQDAVLVSDDGAERHSQGQARRAGNGRLGLPSLRLEGRGR